MKCNSLFSGSAFFSDYFSLHYQKAFTKWAVIRFNPAQMKDNGSFATDSISLVFFIAEVYESL